MSKDTKDTICLAPWLSIHNWPDGKVYPCCVWDSGKPVGNLNQNSLKEVWNSDIMKTTRLQMLNGEKVEACSRCFHLEDTGEHSYRDRINRVHGEHMHYIDQTNDDGSLDFMNLRLWDLRLSNFCNFKCRTCGPGLSSSWYEDAKVLGQGDPNAKALISINDRSKFLEEIEEHYQYVEEIYFAGGEPLLMPEHYIILDRLVELGKTDIPIRYSTNFSKLTFGKKNILDYWKHFSKIELYISIDGVEKTGTYVRKGFNNDEFVNNLTALQNSGIELSAFGLTVTYSVLNILHLFDLVIYFVNSKLIDFSKFDQAGLAFVFNPVTYPTYYDSKFIPRKLKDKFRSRYESFEQELLELGLTQEYALSIRDRFTPVLGHIESGNFDQKEMSECVRITKRLDEIRNENLNDYIFDFGPIETLLDNS